MKTNERLHALTILTRLLEEQASLTQLKSVDITPMTKEICYGFCRHYLRLEAMADYLMDKRPKSTEVWVALLIGLYQLQYMNIPDYAVVQETVALLGKIKKLWAKGLVNAVLRQFCRQRATILADLADNPAFIHGQPSWLLAHIQVDWPMDWEHIAKANDLHPPMTLRVNTQVTSREDYLAQLQQVGIAAEAHSIAPEGIVLASPCDVTTLPGFRDGTISVQDGAAQLAVSLLDLKPGQRVLDACCAPGGKTCHMLEQQPQLGECVALDVEANRLVRVKDNLRRLNLEATTLLGDACLPEQWWDGIPFDRILLDAPCSATGVIRRHSDIKLVRTEADIVRVVGLQFQLLRALWPLLMPGGIMVYATCSVIAAENEQQIAQFASAYPDCHCMPSPYSWARSTGHGVQILPGEHGMDGFFYSILAKK